MIQYNIIEDKDIKIFLYWSTLAKTLLSLLTRADTKAFKFHWFYKPFEKFGTDPAARALFFAKRSIFQWFYKQFWEARVQLQLDGPRTKMSLSPKEFHRFWRNISNYHGESDGSVALLSPCKSAMYWNNISNSLHESNVSDSVDFSIRHVINYLANHWVNRSVHLWIDFCVNHWINF